MDADRAFLQTEIARRLAKIAATPYDIDALQEGLHELRKDVRWFAIFCASVDGLVQLDPTRRPIEH